MEKSPVSCTFTKALPNHFSSSQHILTTSVITSFEQLIFRSKHLRGVDGGEVIGAVPFSWVNNSPRWKRFNLTKVSVFLKEQREKTLDSFDTVISSDIFFLSITFPLNSIVNAIDPKTFKVLWKNKTKQKTATMMKWNKKILEIFFNQVKELW